MKIPGSINYKKLPHNFHSIIKRTHKIQFLSNTINNKPYKGIPIQNKKAMANQFIFNIHGHGLPPTSRSHKSEVIMKSMLDSLYHSLTKKILKEETKNTHKN